MLPNTLTKRPQALLLDAGDTILFMDADALSQALLSLDVRVDPEQISRSMYVAKRAYQAALSAGQNHEDGWSKLMRELLLEVGVEAARCPQLLPALRAIHDDFYFWRKCPSELPAALDRARAQGLRLGIVSNSEGRLESVLTRVGLRPAFEIVVDSHLEGVAKPDPEIFRRALARLDVQPPAALYAGDIPEVDLVGAHAAGMHGVVIDAFDDYSHRPELPRARSVAELIDALLELPG